MTFEIQKLPNGKTRIEFASSSSKKPTVLELSPAQVEQVIGLLAMCQKDHAFSFSLMLSE